MCKQTAIESVGINLNYLEEDVNAALRSAEEIKDPVLTEKLTKIKTEAVGVKDYIKSKTDSKTG
jgi:hypothetical protein